MRTITATIAELAHCESVKGYKAKHRQCCRSLNWIDLNWGRGDDWGTMLKVSKASVLLENSAKDPIAGLPVEAGQTRLIIHMHIFDAAGTARRYRAAKSGFREWFLWSCWKFSQHNSKDE